MRVIFHPEFAKDIRRFEAEYSQVSEVSICQFASEKDGNKPTNNFLQKVLATTIYGVKLPIDSLLNGAGGRRCKSAPASKWGMT
jgi:hypothetical protein